MQLRVKLLGRVLVLGIGLLALGLLAGCGMELTERSTESLQSISPLSDLVVINGNGSVTVKTHALGSLKVETERKARSATRERAQELLDNTDVILSQTANLAKVTAKVPTVQMGETITTSMTISVPYSYAGKLSVTTGNGDVRVYSLDGSGNINTGNGSVVAEDYEGALSVQTGNGSITLKQARITGFSDFNTGNGSINLGVQNLAANLVGTTFNGSVNLTVPTGTGLSLHATTNLGSIRLVRNGVTTTDAKGSLSTTLNHIGPTVTLQTMNGSITVEER